MSATFFTTPAAFNKWLTQNHNTAKELIVGFYKVNSGKASITWSESVDEALCFGWIDGVRKSIDEESYCIRFTPRRPDSIWSPINIKKVEMLTAEGRMKPEGIKAFSFYTAAKSSIYLLRKEAIALDSKYEKLFKKNKTAWFFFNQQAPSYKKVITHWIMSAKQEATQVSRLNKTISASEAQQRLQ